MYQRIILLVVSFFVLTSSNSVKMIKINLDKNVTAKLPMDFTLMSDDDIASRYPAYRKPLAMYISNDRFADFGYNVSNGVWGNDIELLKKVYKATISNSFTRVTFIQDTIIQVKKRNFAVFEYISEMDDNNATGNKTTIKVYSYAKYSLQNGEIYIFNFNCPEKFKDKYQPVAQSIMNSIKINLVPNKHKPTVIESNKNNPNKGKQPVNPYKK